MIRNNILINNIPAILWGKESEKVYLYVHGKSGFKEEAETFALIAQRHGFQVISFDLPGHGERKAEIDKFNPWDMVSELAGVISFVKNRWNKVSIRANSIGALFTLYAMKEEKIEKCLFVSPIINMRKLIENMMQWANVTKQQLQDKKEIKTEFNETLSWKYYEYVVEHPIYKWTIPTCILYAGKDNLTERCTVNDFVQNFNCSLTVMEDGEHWFHTPEQLKVLSSWEERFI